MTITTSKRRADLEAKPGPPGRANVFPVEKVYAPFFADVKENRFSIEKLGKTLYLA